MAYRLVVTRWLVGIAVLSLAVVGLVAAPSRAATVDVTVIGGSGAVSNGVLEHLRSCASGTVSRVAGADRYESAAAVSQKVHPSGASTVYVATGADFPDAAAAGSPAALSGAPILLTARDVLPAATRGELSRLDPDRIILLGGTGAVSSKVESALRSYAPVTRVAGSDRYATAAAVARNADDEWSRRPTVYVATGANFPDALTGSAAAAAAANGPMLLVTANAIPASTRAELEELNPRRIVILGGTAVISSAVENELDSYARTVRRIAGPNRYATAAEVSEDAFDDADQVWIATGDKYPDALVGGAAAGYEDAPVLLVTKYTVPAETAAELSRLTGKPCSAYPSGSTPPSSPPPSSPPPSSPPPTTPPPSSPPSSPPPSTGDWTEPGATWQWQLTGSIDTSVDAQMFDIDYEQSASMVSALHAKGAAVVCYLSAGSWEDWRPDADDFPESVLGNSNGWPGERWLDISNIAVLGPIMEARFDVCAQKGFDGVEIDNIDGYSNNTGFSLSAADQLAYNQFLANAAHARGLAIGMKNNVEQADELEPYFDFAINEECAQYNECGDLSVFIENNKAVFHVEYDGSLSSFCPETTALGFSSMKKRLDLDAWREYCP